MTKRIAFISGTYQPQCCGVAHYSARLREILAGHDVETMVLTTHAAAEAVNDPSVWGVVQDWGLMDVIRLARAIKDTPTDILHIQHAAGTYGFQRPIFLLPPLLRAFGFYKPIITTIHEYGWWEWEPNGIPSGLLEWLKEWGQQHAWWDREDGFLLTGSEAIITTNAEAERVIQKRLPHLAKDLYRIPIGANVEVSPIERKDAQQQLRQHYRWSGDTLAIAFFGFLHPVKGIENLLAAFKQVVVKEPQVRLLLIGGVESLALRGEEAHRYWNKLQTQIAEHDLNQLVAMTGYLSAQKASQYLSGADIGVLPFNHGITLKSGSLLGLFAHALPVIATRHDPPDPDLVDQNLICLVPPRDLDALANALLNLIADQYRRDRLSTTGCILASRFTWSDIGKKHLDIYNLFT